MASPSYETANVVWGKWDRHTRFWARAVDPRGAYNAGETFPIDTNAGGAFCGSEVAGSPSGTSRNHQLLDGLLLRLVNDGWESLGCVGEGYWAYSLRRRVVS